MIPLTIPLAADLDTSATRPSQRNFAYLVCSSHAAGHMRRAGWICEAAVARGSPPWPTGARRA